MRLKRFAGIWLALVLLSFAHCGKAEDVPDELLGVWVSSDARYADRFFRIGKDVIVFGTGAETSEIHSILSTEKLLSGNLIQYNIRYLNQHRQEYTFSVYFDPKNRGSIRLVNQKTIRWTKRVAQ